MTDIDITTLPGYDPTICPRCEAYPLGFAALSRADNETHICGACGTDEALLQYAAVQAGRPPALPGPMRWPVALTLRLPEVPR